MAEYKGCRNKRSRSMGVNLMDITSSSYQGNCDGETEAPDQNTVLIPRILRPEVGDHSRNQSALIQAQETIEKHGALSDEQEGRFYCPIPACRKFFPSKNALHGHMRSHPERRWRGMVRPPGEKHHTYPKKSKKNGTQISNFQRNSSSSDEFNAMKRVVKARRGRKGKMPLYNTDLEETDPVYIASRILMCMPHGSHASSGNMDDSDRSSGSYEHVLLRDLAKARLDEATEDMRIDENENDSSGTWSCKLALKQNSKNIEQRNRSYPCQVCNKSFATHQALGGHTASHNKGKGTVSKANHNNTSALEDQRKEENSTGVSTQTVAKEHKCKVCGAVYRTGQALGGHMRLHYHPSSPPKDPQLFLHSFDLNELPSPECGE